MFVVIYYTCFSPQIGTPENSTQLCKVNCLVMSLCVKLVYHGCFICFY